MVDLYALAFDLGFERKRCLEALQRIQSVLLTPSRMPVDTELRQTVLSQIDSLARSAERLAALTVNIENMLAEERVAPIGALFEEAARLIEEAAGSFKKPVMLEIKNKEMRLDTNTLSAFRPIFLEMLVPFVEYCIESQKERMARGKPQRARIELFVKATEEGHKISVICDGNGVAPPYAGNYGLDLARLGVRAHFEGNPGQTSAWHIFIPIKSATFKVLPVKINGKNFCIPHWAITAIKTQASVAASGEYLIEISAGTSKTSIAVDEPGKVYETYMKPLQAELTAGGRYLGVIMEEHSPEILSLVLDPAFIVYGEELQNAG